MPCVTRRVAELFKKAPFDNINPEAVVAIGASIQASMLGRVRTRSLPDAAPASAPGKAPPVPPSAPGRPPPVPTATAPAAAAQAGATTASPAPPLVLTSPGRAAPEFPPPSGSGAHVAVAPAPSLPAPTPHAPRAVAPSQPEGPLLIDVTPLSLGVETAGGYIDFVLAAGTPIPCDKTRLFVTAADNQTQVMVRVAQGESKRFVENTYLGECELFGLRAGPRGAVSIAVTFEIDANGLLVVDAMRKRQAARQVGG
jgi:molecular chaperone DnaK